MNVSDHPDKQRLADYLSGKLLEEVASTVAEHLSRCDECESTIAALEAKSETFVSGLSRAAPALPYEGETELRRAVANAAKLPSAAPTGPTSSAAPATKGVPKGPVKLGPYQLLAKLGEGGMGAVFKARHEHLDKIVAIKVLPKKAMQDPAAVARFRREMKAVGALHHPNIVGAHDAGEQQGVHFLVMEYVEGSDLSSLIKKNGPVTVEQALSYMQQAAKGLAFAHAKNIVHRDIKPANLLVDVEGTLKILDMGLARLDDGQAANAEANQGLTQTGQVMGTVDYMAPEQAFDTHRADAKADVYSLGCTLYRILTGQNAYGGDTVVQKILAHREQPIPSLTTLRADAPPGLDALYRRMLAKRPEDRPTMAKVAQELEALQRGKESSEQETEGPAPSIVVDVHKAATVVRGPARREGKPAAKPQANAVAGRGAKPPKKRVAAAAAGAFALIALGVWLVIRDPEGNAVAKVDATNGTPRIEIPQGGSVEVVNDNKPNPAAAVNSSPPTFFTSSTAASTTQPSGYALRFGDGASVEMPTLKEQFAAGKPFTVECWITPGYLGLGQTKSPGSPLVEFQGEVPVLGFQHGPPLFLVMNNSGNWSFNLQANELLQRAESPTGVTYSLQPAGVAGGSRNLYLGCTGESRSRRWHLAVVRNGNRLQFFRDGKLYQSLEFPNVTIKPAVNFFSLGGKHGDPARYFHGLIDEVRLSQTARYDKDFSPTEQFVADADTVALYRFDEGAGSVLHDSSGNQHDGKIVGAKWVRADGSPSRLPDEPSQVVAVPRTPLPDGPPGQLPSISVPANPRAIVVAGDGRHVGFMGGPGHPAWLDLTTGKTAWENTTGRAAYIRGSRLSPDGTRWALAGHVHDSNQAYVRILRTADGSEEWSYTAAGPEFIGVAFSPNGKQLAVGNDAGEVRVFELPVGRELRRWQAHDSAVMALAYSRDGLRLVTGAAANTAGADAAPAKQPTLKMWRLPDGVEVPDFFQPRERFSMVDAEVTRDGRFLLLGTTVDTAVIWDMQAGAKLALIRNEANGQRNGNSETPSGTHALVGGDTMLIVESATGRVVQELRDAESRRIHKPIPTPDGRFAIAHGEKLLRIWRLPPECWAPGISSSTPAAAAVAANKTLADPAFQAWLAATQKLPAEQQLAEFSKKLMELNPGFDGKLSGGYGQANPVIEKGVVTGVGFSTVKVNNISPVRLFTELTDLRCNGEALPNTGALTDLSPLQGLRLKTLSCGENRITDLSPLQGMPLLRLDAYANPLGDISALQGMPLTHLSLNNTSYVKDVSPLRGMPLRHFSANSLKATDLSPLAGLPLEGLALRGAAATDLSPLKNCRGLKTLELTRFRGSPDEIVNLQRALPNCKIEWDDPATPVASAPNVGAPTKSAILADPAFQAWLKATQALPAEKQLEAVSKKLMELNPGFDGKLLGGDGYKVPKIEKGVVTGVGFFTDHVTDISPVLAFSGLHDLYCRGNFVGGQSLGKLVDLSPLAGLSLRSVSANYNPLHDLTPLSGMPLTLLDVAWTKVTDIAPLAGMPLEELALNNVSKIREIDSLRGMPLRRLNMNGRQVSDLSPLAGMPLENLSFAASPVADISVLRGMPLTWIDLSNTNVTDLSPLHDCKTLKSMLIKNQRIDPAEIAKLQQALPACKIEFTPAAPSGAADPANIPKADGAWQQETNPDRRVARWVLARGGTVGVLRAGDSQAKNLAVDQDLPAEPFLITSLKVPSSNVEISAAEWQSLGDLRLVRAIDVAGCRPTNEALAAIGRCRTLDFLGMAFHPSFNDEGLKQLTGLTHLRALDIGGGGQTAACLESLGKLTSLHVLKMGGKDLQVQSLKPLQSLVCLQQLDLNGARVADQAVGDLAVLPQLRLLNLHNFGGSPAVIDELLKLRGLYAVSLEGLKIPTAALLKLADHPTLSLVNTYGSGIKPEEYEQLAKALPRLTFLHPELKALNADEVAAIDWAATVCGPFSGYDAQLREQKPHNAELTLNVQKAFAPEEFRRLAKVKNLTRILLWEPNSTNEHLRILFESLREFPHLRSFTITNATFTDTDALAGLPQHTGLTTFELVNSNGVSDDALSILGKLPHLARVRLESDQLTDGVFDHLKPLLELETLTLQRGRKLTGNRLPELRDKPRLWRLELSETGVTDAALGALAELPALEELWIYKTTIGDAGLEQLAGCRNLRLLSVHGTKVTAAGVTKLQQALPQCTIIWNHGFATPIAVPKN